MKTNSLDFDAQALREKILDLAMRGKLVEQNPDDEPASVLLEKIKAEKEQLIKEKKIKKSKALPPISDDEKPFGIPDSWEWVRLGDIVDIRGGKRIPKGKKLEDTVSYKPYIRVADMSQQTILLNNIKYANKDIYDKISHYTISKNDIYFSIAGTIGKVGSIPKQLDGALLTENAAKLVSYNLKLNNLYYLIYILESSVVTTQHKKILSQVAQPKLALIKLKNTVIPLPPLEEQSRIAAKIAQLFALLRKVESSIQQYAKLQTLLKSKVLDLAMRGKLVNQDPDDEPASMLLEKINSSISNKIKNKETKKIRIEQHANDSQLRYSIPSSWKWTRLGNILYKLSDGVHKRPNYQSAGIPFISVKDMSSGRVDLSNCKYISVEDHNKIYPRCDVEYGDIILSKVGTTGVPALVETNIKFDLFVSVALLKFDHKYVNGLFLKYLIESPIVQVQADLNTRGVGNKNWVLRDIAGTVIPFPPLKEQKRITEKINKIINFL